MTTLDDARQFNSHNRFGTCVVAARGLGSIVLGRITHLFPAESYVTTFEHAMLAIDGALAAGLHRHYGWQVVAMAGVAAVSPDWDGLTILVSQSLFAEGHRLWGHNVLACILTGLAIGVLDYRFDFVTRCARWAVKFFHFQLADQHLIVRDRLSKHGLMVWILVGILAALSQLPADMVVSGTATLSDWELKLLWPFSNRGWVFPMVPWGDVGITLVFVVGMFAMLRWRSRVQSIAVVALTFVAVYIAARGTLGG